jgi:hypothetical protein
MMAFRNRLGDRHPDTLLVMQSLLNAVRDNSLQASDLDEAVEIGEQAMDGYERAFPDHPFKHICLANLAIVYRHRGRSTARAANEAALRRLREIFGADHPYALCAATNLANGLAGAGELERAREMSADILEKSRRRRGPHQPYTLICALNHSIDLLETRDPRGEAAWLEAFAAMRRALGDGHPEVKFAEDQKRIDCDIEAPPT